MRPKGTRCRQRGPARAWAGGSSRGEPGTWLSPISFRGHLRRRLQPHDPSASTPQPRPVPSARFPFWHCPLPSHGVICLLSLHFQSPVGHPPSTSHPFCPLTLLPSLLISSPGCLLRGLCRQRCCGPRGQGLLSGEPSVHLCPLGGAGGKFPPSPIPSDRTWRRPRPERRRERRPGSRAPSPARELARSVSLSASAETRRRRRRRELGEDLH